MAAAYGGVVVLAGGFGGSRMTHGLALALADPGTLTAIVNTGDDLELHGLSVCPDLDTVMYTLSGWANEANGWGVREETWSAAEMLGRYGAPTWFSLGDRDLATHILRTAALRAGERLTTVTGRLAGALGIAARLVPMSDDPVRTELRTDGTWLAFQDYFVRRHHAVEVDAVRHVGVEAARPAPEVLSAIAGARAIVLAPSNPFVSIGTILAVPGIADAIRRRGVPTIAVSPIVGGAAVRGPADRMFRSLAGSEPSAATVVAHYRRTWPGLVGTFVIDAQDAASAPAIAADGPERIVVTETLLHGAEERRRLGAEILALAGDA